MGEINQAYSTDLGTGFDSPGLVAGPRRRSNRDVPVTDIDAPGIGDHYSDDETGQRPNSKGSQDRDPSTASSPLPAVMGSGFDHPSTPDGTKENGNLEYPVFDSPGEYVNRISISDEQEPLTIFERQDSAQSKTDKISDFHLERKLSSPDDLDDDDEGLPQLQQNFLLNYDNSPQGAPMVINMLQSGETTDTGETLIQDGTFIPESTQEEPLFYPPVPNQQDIFLPVEATTGESSTDALPAQRTSKPKPSRPPRKAPVFHFEEFAENNFQSGHSATFERKMLKEPLMKHKDKGDRLASLSCWIVILRFMQDFQDPPSPPPRQTGRKRQMPLMAKIFGSLGLKYKDEDFTEVINHGEDLVDAAAKGVTPPRPQRQPSVVEVQQQEESITSIKKKSSNNPVKGLMSLMFERKKSKRKQSKEQPEELVVNKIEQGYFTLFQDLSEEMDKVQYISGHGILRPDIRDEIYCQICKQLNENENETSVKNGWILMALCLGCFPPSKKFLKYLRQFLKKGPEGFDMICIDKLRRTITNGARNQPPSWLELNGLKLQKSLLLRVTLMDGNDVGVPVSSATIAYELCDFVATKVDLRDCFGFSLYIALSHRVCSLGSGTDHVMDAISEFEQFAKQHGHPEKDAPWRLFFRKETFTPWHDSRDDPIATNLIFEQVMRGVIYGEYKLKQEEDVVALAVQKYYIEYGPELKKEILDANLKTFIPEKWQDSSRSPKYWKDKITTEFGNADYVKLRIPAIKVKEGVVDFSMTKWPILFSRFYEAYRYSGPSLPKNDILLAVNWTGLYILDEREHVLVQLSYPEITNSTCSRAGKLHGQTITITTVHGDEYCFTAPNSEDVHDLLLTFLEGLRERAKYGIAIEDYELTKGYEDGEISAVLSFKKGDLIYILDRKNAEKGENPEVEVVTSEPDWMFGECVRTGRKGDFPTQFVHFLPAIVKPPPKILAKVNKYVMSQKGKDHKPGAPTIQFIQVPNEHGQFPWSGESQA